MRTRSRMAVLCLAFGVLCLIAGCSGTGAGLRAGLDEAAGEEKKFDMEPPEELDGNGFFVLPEDTVRELKVKSITTSEWLYEEDGTLVDSERGAHAEYDKSGRLIAFSVHMNPAVFGYNREGEYQYDDEGRILEQRFFSKEGGVRALEYRIVFDYSKPRAKELTAYFDDAAALNSRERYLFDDAGRILKTESLDVVSGRVESEVRREYDENGNWVEELGDGVRRLCTLENNVLTFSGTLEGYPFYVDEYTFDDNGNLLSFAHGEDGDRFTYKLDERGLPVEKACSRRAAFEQDPHEHALTKYSYEYYE